MDLLRFIASAGIVWHHSHQFFYPEQARDALSARTDGLALFVDLFFVISGFIITMIYGSRITSASATLRFLQRRAGRLLPLHWLTLALSWLLWTLVVKGGFAAEHVPELSGKCVAETALLLNGFLPCGNGNVLNGVSWSISIEMVLYLLFPLFALTLRRPRQLIALTVLAMMVSLAWCYRAGSQWDLHVPVLRGIPAFMLGVVLARYRTQLGALKLGNGPWSTMLAATLGLMIFGAPQLIALAAAYSVVLLVVAADAHARATGLVARVAPLGQLTYSIYLWHSLFVTVMMNALADKLLKLGTLPMLGVALVCYASILVTCYFSWRWFETPARKYIDNLGRAPGAATQR